MKRYSQQQIKGLLDKFMDGQTTVEEEAQLADYFRRSDVPAEWEDYRVMFDYFDRGMEGALSPLSMANKPIAKQMGRRWWGIAAAAAIAALIVGITALHHLSKTTPGQTPGTTALAKNDTITPSSTVEVAPQPLTTATPVTQTSPVRHVNSASHVRHLQARNDSLSQENERLQRELADLKRRAFIIDLEANGYKTVIDEDGNIVLIDMEQEIENELNNQPTTNIPSL